MDIVQRFLDFRIKDTIVLLLDDLTSSNHKTVEAAKRTLRIENGIIFINVMSPVGGIRKVMAKTRTTTFVYEYDSNTKLLTSKGERRNVNS